MAQVYAVVLAHVNALSLQAAALLPQFLARHPAAPDETGQGFLACMFELQEILRELNTTGAKAADVQTGAWVVAAKGEMEKLREQVQNVE